MMSFYELSDQDEIANVGGDWDAFAQENDGADATAEKVLGHRIWDFVEGPSTATYLHAIFSRVRHYRKCFETTYRCDSPQDARLFRMHVVPGDDRLRLEHRLVWNKQMQKSLQVVSLSDFRSANRCSVCCAFHLGDTWYDPILQPDEAYFPKSYELCDKCQDFADTHIRKGATGTTPFFR